MSMSNKTDTETEAETETETETENQHTKRKTGRTPPLREVGWEDGRRAGRDMLKLAIK